MRRNYLLTGLVLILAALACTLTTDLPDPTDIPPTFTPAPTQIGVVDTPTAPTSISTPTTTPLPSPTPTQTPLPTATPLPPVRLAYDEFVSVEVASQLAEPSNQIWVAYRNVNDRQERVDVRTPQPETGMQTIYLARPDTAQRVRVIDLPSTVEDDIFWSPNGRYMLYFLREGRGVLASQAGLYLLNLDLGVTLRFYAIDTLQPNGIPGHKPAWSPDSSSFVMALPSGYAIDLFRVGVDGSNFTNLTDSPTYDFWPAWSPDGTKIAFVSDRAECSTYQPNVDGTCYAPDSPSPRSGSLYLLEVETGQVQKVNDTVVDGPPEWIDNRYLTVTTGSTDLLATSSELWLYDIVAGSAWPVTPQDGALYSAPTWSPDVTQVAYQRAGDTTAIVLADQLGDELARLDQYIFPRLGVSLSWSVSGDFLAIGGRNGQCPYGIIVVNKAFQLVTAPATNLLACDPVYAPTGRYLAFNGIRPLPGTDARQDIYVAGLNGLGATNITSSLQGQISLIGWLGPSSDTEAP